MMVLNNAPTKPSTVFLGDRAISGVRPNSLPKGPGMRDPFAIVAYRFLLTPDVREDVIADDKRRRYPEPNHSFKNIVDNEMARCSIVGQFPISTR